MLQRKHLQTKRQCVRACVGTRVCCNWSGREGGAGIQGRMLDVQRHKKRAPNGLEKSSVVKG